MSTKEYDFSYFHNEIDEDTATNILIDVGKRDLTTILCDSDITTLEVNDTGNNKLYINHDTLKMVISPDKLSRANKILILCLGTIIRHTFPRFFFVHDEVIAHFLHRKGYNYLLCPASWTDTGFIFCMSYLPRTQTYEKILDRLEHILERSYKDGKIDYINEITDVYVKGGFPIDHYHRFFNVDGHLSTQDIELLENYVASASLQCNELNGFEKPVMLRLMTVSLNKNWSKSNITSIPKYYLADMKPSIKKLKLVKGLPDDDV